MASSAGQRPTPHDQPEEGHDLNERTDRRISPEQLKRIVAHVNEILEYQRAHGLEEKGPSLSG